MKDDDMRAWSPESEPPRSADGDVRLVGAASLCLCTPGGDLGGADPRGVFFRGTRILSRWDLAIDGRTPEPLVAMVPEAHRGIFLGRLPRRPGRTGTTLLVQRDRRVGDGLWEDLTIRNSSGLPAACTVTITAEADFADLCEVEDGEVRARADGRARALADRLVLDQHRHGRHRGAVVLAPGASFETGGTGGTGPYADRSAATIRYQVVVPARGQWTASILVQPLVDEAVVEPYRPLLCPLAESGPARRRRRRQGRTPIAVTGYDGWWRMVGPHDPSLVVVAGAPWFTALLGRDSSLAASPALPVDCSLASGTVGTPVPHQGRVTAPLTEEEPRPEPTWGSWGRARWSPPASPVTGDPRGGRSACGRGRGPGRPWRRRT